MYVISGNFGNQTIAVMQWTFEQGLQNVTVVSIDTGWADEHWQQRVDQAELFAKRCGFETARLKSKLTFAELMRDRKHFPSTKFQWCAGFLKGLTLLDWLEEVDPSCEAVIIMGKRRGGSRADLNLAEYIEESPHHGDRKVWHPLFDLTDQSFVQLIQNAGFELLNHRSMECDPCVNNISSDFANISDKALKKTKRLEKELGKTMFVMPIAEMVKQAKQARDKIKMDIKGGEQFDMGCGSPYGCGE